MFRHLGNLLSKCWFIVLALWIAAFVTLRMTAPPFNDVAKGGEFVFLPDSMSSRQAEMLFSRAFPDRRTTSNIVIVVQRDTDKGLTDADKEFITDKLTPAIVDVRDKSNGTPKSKSDDSNIDQKKETDQKKEADQKKDGDQKKERSQTKIITAIHDLSDKGIGPLLVSDDQKASLVTIELALDFQDTRNWQPLHDVEQVISDLQSHKAVPEGLNIAVTGSATLGRDLTQAQADSARKTGPLTITLVVILLAVIYRAPLLALISLATLFFSVDIALRLLTILGSAGYVPLFKGLQEYTTVISYGPGIDYCLFLIARYKENLKACIPEKQALIDAIGQVGPAIAASAATVICGIGMLTFAQFGKFHEAGIGIGVALIIMLVAVLTLTPSMLFVVGHWSFWPMPGVRCEQNNREVNVQSNFFQPMWTFMGHVIERHPLRMLILTMLIMAPFMAVGLYYYDSVSYGLLESLPKSAVSAQGAKVLEQHFPAGITGPIQVMVKNDKLDFSEDDGIAVVKDLSVRLMKRKAELQIADVRSVATPLGTSPKSSHDTSDESVASKTVEKREIRRHAIDHYVSSVSELSGHVTEVDIIPTMNPFAMESIGVLDRLMQAIPGELPKDQRANTTLTVLGPTASVRDLNLVSHSDQWRIDILVVSCVLVILMALLRTITVSIYLMLTVLMSYVATLGMTWLLFYGLDPQGFIGLDWTVPLFLFVVLIAVGEDYNIFLVTRVHEEQKRTNPKQGIVDALSRTGGIITSCGFIMAGTFASLCPNALVRMQQLGFALAFGVLLDTFVVRPILVPSFIMILNDERFGRLARYLK